MTTPFLKPLDTMSEVAQSFQIKQWWLLGCKSICCYRCVAGPTSGNGSMVAINMPNDQIGIRTATNADDLYLLTTKRMMRMDDGHPSPNSLG